MFLRNRWYIAALSEELGDRPLARTLLGEPLVLYRSANGSPVALEDRCCHRQAPLSLGTVVDGQLQCGYHGLRFDESGACVRVPGQAAVPPGARVRHYPALERQGLVHVWTGDPARADTAAAYDFPFAARPGWKARYAKLHAKCNYRLLVDNLLDLSHLAFAHVTTIGSPGVAEHADMKVERRDDGVRVTRWMLDIEPAPALARATGHAGNVDRWQIIDYTPPGFIRLTVGMAVAGTGAREGGRNGILLDRHTLHIVSPETPVTTNYFWCMTHDAAQLDSEQERIIYEQSLRAFNEDLVIIEAQQQRMDSAIPTVDVNADSGVLQARRLLDRLLAAEAAAAA